MLEFSKIKYKLNLRLKYKGAPKSFDSMTPSRITTGGVSAIKTPTASHGKRSEGW